MRKRWIQINGELVPADEATYLSEPRTATIIGDIKPYRSMITGEMIDGRRDHKEHLKKHGVVEVGNDFDNAKPKDWNAPAKGLKERIAAIAYEKLRY